ncbi:SpoIIIAH-like family protein [Paenibacillus silviterrae]|uniref:SpoIIIAH-like family protein n=1 Tax=Paenibacillus silviterrae TaxID=3242194 RepID=UPI0025435FD5|nr:SpoIIIAH-like family protein [Paenibacillus chinjuensis]
MNTKRQTVWLVSMLSLMVVLSAYYLFTEDVNDLNFNATGTTSKEVVVTGLEPKTNAAPQAAPAAEDKKQAPADAAKTDPKADPKASSTKTDQPSAAQPDGKSGAAAQPVSSNQASSDAKIIQQVQASAQAKSGSDYFVNLQMKRNEEFTKQFEKLMAIIVEPAKNSAEATAKAQEDLRKLEDLEAKFTNLEETLLKDFPQAVVTQEAGKYKVTVQATKLEKSQALSIADKTMEQLAIGPDNIAITYVP